MSSLSLETLSVLSQLRQQVPDLSWRTLGEGTSGIVALLSSGTYNSLHFQDAKEEIGLPVVIKKFFRPSKGSEIVDEGIRREIWTLKKLTDLSFVPRLYYTGSVGSEEYILMEYAGPQNMKEQYILSKSSLPRKDFVAFAAFLVKIVADFLGKKWVHCDLKPDNLFFWEDGKNHEENIRGETPFSDEVKRTLVKYYCRVVDFGLAFEEDLRFPNPADDVQTANYRSARGILSGVVDHRHEFPSLAAIFFEIYTLSPLFPYPKKIMDFFRNAHSLLQLYYTFALTKTPSQETIAHFYAQNRPRVERYFAKKGAGKESVFVFKVPGGSPVMFIDESGEIKRFSYNNFFPLCQTFQEDRRKELKEASFQKGDSEEFCNHLQALVERLVDADNPPSLAELFAHPLFQ